MTKHSVDPGQRDDLANRLGVAVRERTAGRLRNARVAVSEGTVTVSGIASTFYLKQLAQEAVRATLVGLPFRLELKVTIHVC
jgi:hypothetical protein